jgi:hypothetical protein
MRKSMVMAAILAIALTGFVGFLSAEEPPVDDPVFTVTDTFAPFDDRNAYVGDTFNFTVAPYDAPLNNSNVSVEITIGVVTYDMIWNVDIDMWVYEFTPVIGDVGKHIVTINATAANTTGIWNATATDITVWGSVAFVSTAVLPTFTEGTTTSWVISNFFTPLVDTAEEPLTFAAEGGFPTGWTFTPSVVENVTTWAVTPPAEFSGSVDINVTATDTNDIMVYHVFTLVVGAVNDGPVIEGIMVGADLLTVETWNAGNTTVPDMVTGINLSMTEDTSLDIMVHATDIDSTGLTYVMTEDEALYAVALTEYINETNVTFTVPTNFTLTPVANANGNFWAELNVSDGTLWAAVMVYVMIAPANDAPTATEAWDMTYARKTGEEINLTLANIADIDGDVVTPMWYIDGTVVADWDEIYFVKTWATAGTYNVSAKISDGTSTVDVGYFHVTVTNANRAPTITSTTASKAEITEGDPVTLKVVATDLDSDTLTYLWKNDKDTSFTSNKSEVEVKDLKEGTYKFTVTVSDGTETATGNVTVTVKPEEKDDGITTIIIIVIAIIAILAILIILFFVLRGGKEEEEIATAEAPAEGEEAPTEEEQPVTEETPTEDVPEAATEETPVETGEEVPIAPAPSQ